MGTAGAVEHVKFRHVRFGQREVEDLRVLREPVAVRRLRDQGNVTLDAPAKQHLGRRAPEALRDPWGTPSGGSGRAARERRQLSFSTEYQTRSATSRSSSLVRASLR